MNFMRYVLSGMKVASRLMTLMSGQNRFQLSLSSSISTNAKINWFPFADRADVMKFPLFPTRDDLQNFSKRLIRPPSVPVSVGAIIKETRDDNSKENLLKWEKKTKESMGEEAFQSMRKETIDGGGAFHSVMEQFTSGIPLDNIVVSQQVENYWKSLHGSLKDFTPSNTSAVEKMIQHPFLCYRGRIDGLVNFKNNLYLVEWKTSGKPSPAMKNNQKLKDYQLQIAAYVGALNATLFLDDQLDRAVVATCYQTGETAEIREFDRKDLQDYWNQWLLRVHQHWQTYAMEKSLAAKSQSK